MSKALNIIILFISFNFFCEASMPENLQGTWKLDRDGTSTLYRSSPDWNDKKERYLGDIIDYIGRYTFIFKEDKIERHFYREILSWDLDKPEKDNTVLTFPSKNKEGKELEVQITKMGPEVIHIRIGTEDNYRLCAWRKEAQKAPQKPASPPTLEEQLEKLMQEEGREALKI
jgi:hypothetical protein